MSGDVAGGAADGDERARSTADAVARRSYGKLVAFLAAQSRDVAAAEDALSEAFAAALADWPVNGCPANPEAWLLTAARRKLIDFARRRRSGANAAEELRVLAEQLEVVAEGAGETPVIPDQRLALMFACAHPAIEAGIRAPLMLQAVLGLDASAIASAFLLSPTAMGQRLVRAKTKIREAGIPFRIPAHDELPERLGTDVARRDLAEEAIFLGRLATALLPDEPEALGLLALMLHAEARRRSRRDARGEYVPLAAQDPALWNVEMIDEAEALLLRASEQGAPGRYQLEAALQSAHVDRRRTGRSDWPAVVQIYDALLALSGSPVVAINRALALAQIDGAPAGLAALDEVAQDARLEEYQPYWAARAELLANVGARADAHAAYDIAIGLERDPAVRKFLQERQASLASAG